MTFGERLYQLRKEKNLSQEDLAERLGVSRQSVSRWENGTAAPDFEKTVRLSEIFETTTDYLLKGSTAFSNVPAPEMENPAAKILLPTWHKILVAVLWVLSGIAVLIGLFFGGWWDYYLFVPLPLAVLGSLLLFSRKRTLLRAIWVLYLSTTTLIYTSLSLHWSQAFLLFRPHLPAFDRYIRFGFALLLLMLAVVIYTACTFRKYPIKNKKLHLLALCLMPPAYLLQELISALLSEPLLQLTMEQGHLFMAINLLLSLLRLAIITAFAILLAQTIHKNRKK